VRVLPRAALLPRRLPGGHDLRIRRLLRRGRDLLWRGLWERRGENLRLRSRVLRGADPVRERGVLRPAGQPLPPGRGRERLLRRSLRERSLPLIAEVASAGRRAAGGHPDEPGPHVPKLVRRAEEAGRRAERWRKRARFIQRSDGAWGPPGGRGCCGTPTRLTGRGLPAARFALPASCLPLGTTTDRVDSPRPPAVPSPPTDEERTPNGSSGSRAERVVRVGLGPHSATDRRT
jgi:hypothetical protein